MGDPHPGDGGVSAARRAMVATVVAAGLMVAIQVVGADLATAPAPLGLVSLQGAADPTTAAAMVASWDGVLRTAALRAHALDLLLPVAYGVATWSAGAALAGGSAAGRPAATLARRAGSAGVAAAVLDQLENAAIAVTLLDAPSPVTVTVTVAAALGKWVLLGLSLAGLALAWRRAATASRRGAVPAG